MYWYSQLNNEEFDLLMNGIDPYEYTRRKTRERIEADGDEYEYYD